MERPGSDGGMKRPTAAIPALSDCLSRRPRNGPRLGGQGDVMSGNDAGGFSQAVIPAKGEAREPDPWVAWVRRCGTKSRMAATP